MSDIYYLFLDESESHDSNGDNRVFCIAGFIIKENDYNNLESDIMSLKQIIWNDLPQPENIVMHEQDIRYANNRHNRGKLNKINSEFHRFKENSITRQLYDELKNVIEKNPITIIGSCVLLDKLNNYFSKEIVSDKYLIAMQIVLENFIHFLQKNSGVGYIFYESREEPNDKEVRMRFNHIKAIGSMFISPYAIQKHLVEINFPPKNSNMAGLQLADFIPNNFARKHGVNNKHRINIYNSVRKIRYDGGLSNQNRFGIKVMP